MTTLVQHLPRLGDEQKTALIQKNIEISYKELNQQITDLAKGLQSVGIGSLARVAIYLPKTIENIVSIFATNQAGGVFVPVNPNLKSDQVRHIINDCDVKILITNKARFVGLRDSLADMPSLSHIVLVDGHSEGQDANDSITILNWMELKDSSKTNNLTTHCSPYNMAAILYTSGSTGKPKGVVLSHQNLVLGAKSVSEYLGITDQEVILAILPLSFDYGLNQVLTSLFKGATCILHDYFLPNDVLKLVEKHQVTALAGVPPLWNQILQLDWPQAVAKSIRYITNSGGAFSEKLKNLAQEKLPQTDIYAMYGLTEAFRSTYLPPTELDKRPLSMGKAIPNAEILIVREDGTICDNNEIGELIHRGPLVSMGYWNNPLLTSIRFKPAPGVPEEIPLKEMAVYSGDLAYRDAEGFLFFVGRNDDMIKTSGYRVSPGEVEEVILTHTNVNEAAAFGINHEELGQAILVVATARDDLQSQEELSTELKLLCQQKLANYMVPKAILIRSHLPRNNNQKIDRALLKQEYASHWTN